MDCNKKWEKLLNLGFCQWFSLPLNLTWDEQKVSAFFFPLHGHPLCQSEELPVLCESLAVVI